MLRLVSLSVPQGVNRKAASRTKESKAITELQPNIVQSGNETRRKTAQNECGRGGGNVEI